MHRRQFLTLTASGVIAVSAGAALTGCNLRKPDANGLQLAPGFTSRIVAVRGQEVASTGYRWHVDPDGGACFPTIGGGWIYVSNSETAAANGGGASMIRFAADGQITEARRILGGTSTNCAGGATPWGTWLSCEEHEAGRVWECDPAGRTAALVRPGLGSFHHEAAAAHVPGRAVYLTEDRSDGGLYRFLPTTWGDLSAGVLQVLAGPDEALRWARVPDPSAAAGPTRHQVPDTRPFKGGEGIVVIGDEIYFTTKNDGRIWCYHAAANSLRVHYEPRRFTTPVLTGVDNVTSLPGGDLIVSEDGGNLEIVRVRKDGMAEAIVRLTGKENTELAGPAFSPDHRRLYFSEQDSPGTTYEVSGPF